MGGAAYLSELAQTVVSGANAEYYSTIVRDKSLQRSLIGACSDIISNCFDQSRSVDALLDESEPGRLFHLGTYLRQGLQKLQGTGQPAFLRN